jgi:catechol 2,3-dioxygenase-like lactoylglutathione lyase family enzyme
MPDLHEVAFFTDQVDAVADLVEAILGRPAAHRSESFASFDAGNGTRINVHVRCEPLEGGPPNEDHVAFGTADLEGVCRRLAERGYALLVPPTDWPWGRSAYLRDPDGRMLELSQTGGG